MKNFDVFYAALKDYKSEHGNLLVPGSYKKDGYSLGLKVQWIRGGQMLLTPEQKEKVDELGFVWRVRNYQLCFPEIVKYLKIYNEKYGNCNVPVNYVTENGIKLGQVLANIRSGARKVTKDESAILSNMGVSFRNRKTRRNISAMQFEKIYKDLKEYHLKNGNVEVPEAYVSPDGLRLGSYVQKIRRGTYHVSKKEKRMLDKLEFRWKYTKKTRHSFEEVLDALKEYLEVYHTFDVPYDYTAKNGVRLGRTIRNLKYGYRKVTDEEREILEYLGMVL